MRILVEDGGAVIVARKTDVSKSMGFQGVVGPNGLGVIVRSSVTTTEPQPIFLEWSYNG